MELLDHIALGRKENHFYQLKMFDHTNMTMRKVKQAFVYQSVLVPDGLYYAVLN